VALWTATAGALLFAALGAGSAAGQQGQQERFTSAGDVGRTRSLLRCSLERRY